MHLTIILQRTHLNVASLAIVAFLYLVYTALLSTVAKWRKLVLSSVAMLASAQKLTHTTMHRFIRDIKAYNSCFLAIILSCVYILDNFCPDQGRVF